jgi:hypothetical protein
MMDSNRLISGRFYFKLSRKTKSAIDLYSAMGFNLVESKERDAEDIIWMCQTLAC